MTRFCPSCGEHIRSTFYEHAEAHHPGRGKLIMVKFDDPLDDIKPGDLVEIVYKDHALLRNVEPGKALPILRNVVGRLERQDSESVYLVVDEYEEPGAVPVRKTSGFVVLKSTVVELKPPSAGERSDA